MRERLAVLKRGGVGVTAPAGTLHDGSGTSPTRRVGVSYGTLERRAASMVDATSIGISQPSRPSFSASCVTFRT
jgi:hypothetical protein